MLQSIRAWLIPAAALVLIPAVPAPAQDEYRLAEDDTWVETKTADPSTSEGQLAAARRALARGEIERAEHLATQWIARYEQHPLLADAYIIRGDALMAGRDYYEALFEYEYVARTFIGSEAFVTALQRELEIANLFATGTRRKLWGMRFVDASDEAEELLIRIQERLPGSRLAEEAGMALGDFYFSRRQMGLAAEMYAIYIENYPQAEEIDKARKRLIYAHLASFKGPEFDASGLYDARARLRELKVVAPATAQQMGADALLTRIDESDAQKLLSAARWHLRTGDVIAAELTIRRLARAYPRSVAAADAMRLIERLLPRLPEATLEEAPDYEALRGAILGPPPGEDPPRPPGKLAEPETADTEPSAATESEKRP
ncbi:MAG: outer membrane protein assembly factor BamD [Planctomycetota bacterium]|nr:outer membrane protein assembly factor BamD [Planctomycetota bacterium]